MNISIHSFHSSQKLQDLHRSSSSLKQNQYHFQNGKKLIVPEGNASRLGQSRKKLVTPIELSEVNEGGSNKSKEQEKFQEEGDDGATSPATCIFLVLFASLVLQITGAVLIFDAFPLVTISNASETKLLQYECTQMGSKMALFNFKELGKQVQFCNCGPLECDADIEIFQLVYQWEQSNHKQCLQKAVDVFTKQGVLELDMNKTYSNVHIHCDDIFLSAVQTDKSIRLADKELLIWGLVVLLLGSIGYMIVCSQATELSEEQRQQMMEMHEVLDPDLSTESQNKARIAPKTLSIKTAGLDIESHTDRSPHQATPKTTNMANGWKTADHVK